LITSNYVIAITSIPKSLVDEACVGAGIASDCVVTFVGIKGGIERVVEADIRASTSDCVVAFSSIEASTP
jgi:hypothetical protein